MARHQSFLTNWSQYIALRAVSGLIQCFGIRQNLSTAATVGSLFSLINPRRCKRAEINIALSFPHWSEERVQHVAQQSLINMFQLFMVDALVMPRLITSSSWSQYVQVGHLDQVVEPLIRKQPIIFLTGHCGNWELLGFALAAIGYPITALARPLDNPLIDKWLQDIRQAQGQRIITKFGATPILQETLKEGGQLGFIADQNAGDQGLFVPFFGRMASSYKSIGLLAMRYNVPIITGHARRIRGSYRYEITCPDVMTPDDWVDQPDPLFYITSRFNRALELMIRRAPEQYLWLHRRWKSRPKYERSGQPMPHRIITKLEQLPWMTQAERDHIIANSNAGIGGAT